MPAAAGEKKDGSADSSPSPRNKKAALAKKTTTPKAADGANRAPAAKKEAASVETDSDEESKKSKQQQQSAAAVKPAVKKDVEAPKKQAPTKSKEENPAVVAQNRDVQDRAQPKEAPKDCKLRVWDKVESDAYTYRLTELLGAGGYGDVFEAEAVSRTTKEQDGAKKQVAIKAALSKQTLGLEALALREAAARECKHIPKIFDSGVFRNRPHNFVSMELKGRDLYQLRKEQANSKFTLATAVRVGLQTLEAIEELHNGGFISRDIKPGNFVTGLTHPGDDLRNVYLIDFGLCKKYRDLNGKVVPTRGEIGWRGTNRYGSLQAHRRMDLGRRDDMESWFYTLVELTKGSLPWATERDRNAIFDKKLAARRNVDQFLDGCPAEYKELLSIIDAMKFEDEPDYPRMRKLLEQIITNQKIDRNAPMDWEQDERRADPEGPEPSDTHSPTTQRRQRM